MRRQDVKFVVVRIWRAGPRRQLLARLQVRCLDFWLAFPHGDPTAPASILPSTIAAMIRALGDARNAHFAWNDGRLEPPDG